MGGGRDRERIGEKEACGARGARQFIFKYHIFFGIDAAIGVEYALLHGLRKAALGIVEAGTDG